MGSRTLEGVETYQGVAFGFLEIIIPVQRIEPTVQEKPRPVPLSDDEAPLTQRFRVLSEDKVDLVAFQMAECFDDAVWWDDGLVFQH